MTDICIIFDLDGTLVDSETLCNQAFVDLLPALRDPVEILVERYRGKKLASIFIDIEKRIGARLPSDFEKHYRQRVSELFESDLKPIPGAISMLEQANYAKCIASSGPPAKIRQALEITGLAQYFGKNIFSSYDIGTWKPEPGLFLHAAKAMGFSPHQCGVVEDSDVGIEAAIAAQMRVFHYSRDIPKPSPTAVTRISDLGQLNAHIKQTWP
ncbi:HAD-IA family hydrolase [Agrobacterium vitis]|uniref:HAD-IA family hydrolase n=1 Tax=Agrobacterium vitis TaxID=373 RepID=A0AAE4W9Z7_AGRVI|nr:HAD-IA family hydrolase [Agrobacterium vitis]MCF1497918.1 HAD-IA family hydrolase [Allorhizobium sp. Av2]MCM2438614.1 HAD-IA family hydrolase [Agrobacterium vitis]MUZ56059.1 HAD-IA family hydrolase [Agrobacterium vitis]MVA64803.1 HAD-IA family hydrolase [Agrobacterium vitis]MVA85774.1 HAD-IA family hydrolase [Agrobacterium vitis]